MNQDNYAQVKQELRQLNAVLLKWRKEYCENDYMILRRNLTLFSQYIMGDIIDRPVLDTRINKYLENICKLNMEESMGRLSN